IEFRNKPWADVFAWLGDVTGLPVIANTKPTGTFTFVSPKPGKGYTLTEVFDILNEALLPRNYLLIRGGRGFTPVPADEEPPAVPRLDPLRLEDLEGRGQTELLSGVIHLRTLRAEEIAPDVKKLLGKFGAATALKAANRLVVRDTAANLRRVVRMIQ